MIPGRRLRLAAQEEEVPVKTKEWPAGKTYELKGLKVTVSAPVVLGRSSSFLYYPQILRLPGGELLCSMRMEDDTLSGNAQGKASFIFSGDGGLNWSDPLVAGIHSYSQVARPSGDLVLLPFTLYPRDDGIGGDYAIVPSGRREVTIVPNGLTVTGWPKKLRPPQPKLKQAHFLFDGQTTKLRNGKYLATLYGYFQEEGDDQKYRLVYDDQCVLVDAQGRQKRYSLVAAESADGINWRVCSIIADEQCKLPGGEGPCEPTLCRLPDGRLMCLFRLCGSADNPQPYGQCFSSDEGRTWTEPVSMGNGIQSVEPSLQVLKDGTVALSGGRPGVYLWLNADGSGKGWQAVDLLAHHNALCPDDAIARAQPHGRGTSSSYTEMAVLDEKHLLLVYDREPLTFPRPPKDSKDRRESFACYVVRVAVERATR